ncbi:hypothetical protein GMSM_27390 [Geomonas sp. Red276]
MPQAIADTSQRVLIVDDDSLMRARFSDTLREAGMETATAACAAEALTTFTQWQPDLVLLDLIMPGPDGFETCREIRALSRARHIPVLMVTGNNDSALISRAFEAGATDFVSKSIAPELLVYRVLCLLRGSRLLQKLQESEDRLARTQQIAHLGDWEWLPETGEFWQSPEMSRILGLAPEFPASFETLLQAVAPGERETVRENLQFALTSTSGCDFECHVVRPDGSHRLVWIYARHEQEELSLPLRLVGTLQDVTEIRGVEDRNQMLKEAVDSLQIGITFADAHGRIVYLNPAEAHMHGFQVRDLVGRLARDFADPDAGHSPPAPSVGEGRVWRRESVNVRRSGERFPVLLTSIPIRDRYNRYLGMVTTCEDISEQKLAEEKINRLAYFDSLTGLPNRAMFLERLHQALTVAARSGERIGLMFLDLDKFKDINDTLGHAMGDKLLCEVAHRLENCTRESDVLARLGGDEFVVLLTVVASQTGVATAAQRMLDSLASPFQIDGRTVYTSASIGIAFYPDDSHDASSLFCSADTAMYHAKKEGRSHYRLCSAEMNREIMRRVAMETSLRRGLEREEFFLHYQPQWDLRSGRIVGAEALIRWQSAEFGLMYPSDFVPLIEDSDLIFTIGDWVLREACSQARRWTETIAKDFRVAVNISGKQLKQPEFIERLAGIIGETGVEPASVELEFTESVIMEHVSRTRDKLNQLKRMGVQLTIDDFGTGYSSLNYLKHFEVDRIKIDRSFVTDLPESEGDGAIVKAIINMGRIMNLKVLAEGVETAEQLEYLAGLGCDEVQGYFLARPMPVEDLSDGILPAAVHGTQIAPPRGSELTPAAAP